MGLLVHNGCSTTQFFCSEASRLYHPIVTATYNERFVESQSRHIRDDLQYVSNFFKVPHAPDS
jgi:hypothetical protein